VDDFGQKLLTIHKQQHDCREEELGDQKSPCMTDCGTLDDGGANQGGYLHKAKVEYNISDHEEYTFRKDIKRCCLTDP